ncbi:MAG: hypothetical protein Q9M89_06325 [Persephonella sp.]|nr:hypothetical protein [Persephonella sp.]
MKKKIFIGIIVVVALFFAFSYFSAKAVPKIAVININGVISDYETVIQNIETAQIDRSVKAVVIAVDSPGGAVGAAQEIYSAIKS